MKIVVTCLFFVIAAGFVTVGVRQLDQLRDMRVPASAYQQVAGTLVRVERHLDTNPGYGDQPGSTRALYSIVFRYRLDQRERTAETISPLCDYCSADDVQRIVGKGPGQLAAGDPLTVYVRKQRPDQAYLGLPQDGDIRDKWWEVFLLLIAVPGVLVAATRLDWTSSTSD